MSRKTVFGKRIGGEKQYLLFLIAVSVLLMTFGSMTSFLFPIHVGVDQNCFFTIGKSVLDGKVLYRDIYDQKGPLLFFIHTLAAMISGENFLGVYLIQIINFTIILYYIGKISGLFIGERYRYLVTSATGLIIVTAFCYSRGDNAEEYCMTFYMIALYHLLRYFKGGCKKFDSRLMLVNGFFAACILWIKFTMLGFYIAWCLVIGITLIKRESFLSAVKAAACFLLGMVIGTIPYIIYFIKTDAMADFIWAYFYTNICMYTTKLTMLERIQVFFTKDMLWNPVMMPVLLYGLYYFGKSEEMLEEKWQRVCLLLIAICTYVFVFIGGTRYRYYLLIFGSFTVFGVIALIKTFEGRIAKWMENRQKTITIAVLLFVISLLAGSNCARYYFKSADYYPQVKIAKIIKEDHGTVLNYNFLDAGIYLLSGSKLPDTRYFSRQNILREEFPELFEEPEAIIRNKGVDYVVMRYGKGKPLSEFMECPELLQNYEEIAQFYEKVDDYHFVLFKLKK